MKKSKKKKGGNWNFPAQRKHRDNIELLIAYPEFQQEIKKIRLKMGLITKENEKPNCGQEWMDKMIKKSDEIESDPKFIAQLRRIREKLHNGEISMKLADKQSKLLHNRLPFNYLHDSMDVLIKKFHLPLNYDIFLRTYITGGVKWIPSSNFDISGYTGLISERKNLGYVPIKIYSKLSDEDLKELKTRVNDWFGDYLPKYQALKGIDKKIEIAEWHNNRTKCDEATGEEYKTGNKEIAQNLLGSKKANAKVYEVSRAIKRLWHSRFGKE